jgi:hypothetical protein
MVVLFFAIGKNNFTFSTREFADYLKRSVVTQTDQKKVVALEVKIIKKLNILKSIPFFYF